MRLSRSHTLSSARHALSESQVTGASGISSGSPVSFPWPPSPNVVPPPPSPPAEVDPSPSPASPSPSPASVDDEVVVPPLPAAGVPGSSSPPEQLTTAILNEEREQRISAEYFIGPRV